MPSGVRTRDIWNHNPALYRLSYGHRDLFSLADVHKHIFSDEDIKLVGGRRQLGCAALGGLRRIRAFDAQQNRELVFVTNMAHLAASTIAAIYWERWQIETFFKSLKQLLKIKTFVGTSEKAVMTRIWTALIAMLWWRCFANSCLFIAIYGLG